MTTGVGMPAHLYLEEFGSHVWAAFGTPSYLVGSAAKGKAWRDVDVRLILSDRECEDLFGTPRPGHTCARWVAFTLAFSALGRHMTGLPIDFQIQSQSQANNPEYEREPRHALGLVELRFTTKDQLTPVGPPQLSPVTPVALNPTIEDSNKNAVQHQEDK